MINDWSKNSCIVLFTLGWIQVATAPIDIFIFESDTIRVSIFDSDDNKYVSFLTRRD